MTAFVRADAGLVESRAGIDGFPLSHVTLTRADSIKMEPIEWLWREWLPVGKLTVFGGAPGTGKTTIAAGNMAATVSTGGRWPDGSRAPLGNVVIWSGEDDPADTLIPRLVVAGADLTRVFFVGEVKEGMDRRSFDPSRDMPALRHALAEAGGAKLLIVDPIVSAISGDSHKNAEVRRGLQPLVDLASTMRCALLGITHFTKGTGGRDPVERLTGSLAFGALARVVLVAAKGEPDMDGNAPRLFLRAKSNIGPDDGGFTYDLHQGEVHGHPGMFSSYVGWGSAVEGSARDLLATAEASAEDGEADSVGEAVAFLADVLACGSVAAVEVKKRAKGEGIAERTLQRAYKKLGVKSERAGFGKGAIWFLPANV